MTCPQHTLSYDPEYRLYPLHTVTTYAGLVNGAFPMSPQNYNCPTNNIVPHLTDRFNIPGIKENKIPQRNLLHPPIPNITYICAPHCTVKMSNRTAPADHEISKDRIPPRRTIPPKTNNRTELRGGDVESSQTSHCAVLHRKKHEKTSNHPCPTVVSLEMGSICTLK